jgi:hypothetical protein
MDVVALALDVHRALDAGGVAHAFGGALAFGYYAETRATVDVDVSVFVDIARVDAVVDLLRPIGLERVPNQRMPIGGVELRRAGRDRCDLFSDLDPRYAEIRARCEVFPFGPEAVPMPFLSVEDVVMFKLSFGRPKDWVDLESLVAYNPGLDVEQIEDLLVHLRGPSMHPRLARLRAMIATRGGGG